MFDLPVSINNFEGYNAKQNYRKPKYYRSRCRQKPKQVHLLMED